MNHNKLVKALESIMPLGGWSCTGTDVTIHNEGLGYGYSIPSQSDIDNEILKIEINEPILVKLADLDEVISRGKEKFAKERKDKDGNSINLALTEAEETAIIEKQLLRTNLNKEI